MRSMFAVAVLAVFAFAGCQQTGNTSATAPVNSLCAMSGEELDADSPTATHDGKTVAFCCKRCLGKFNKLDDADKAEKIAASMK